MIFKNRLDQRVALLTLQIIAHLTAIPMIIFASPKHYLMTLIVYFCMGCLGMSMTYHRLLSHRSWGAPKWFEYLGTLCATVGLTGSSLAWSATHRQHHQYADQKNDPHSPYYKNIFSVQFLSMFGGSHLKYATDLLRSPFHKWIHRNYLVINIAYGFMLVAIDPFAIIYAHLFPAALLWSAGSSINSLGHIWGYRNFETADHSRNNIWLALITWGEGWHNNHHRYLKKYYFGVKWFEFDISGFIINILKIRSSDSTLN